MIRYHKRSKIQMIGSQNYQAQKARHSLRQQAMQAHNNKEQNYLQMNQEQCPLKIVQFKDGEQWTTPTKTDLSYIEELNQINKQSDKESGFRKSKSGNDLTLLASRPSKEESLPTEDNELDKIGLGSQDWKPLQAAHLSCTKDAIKLNSEF